MAPNTKQITRDYFDSLLLEQRLMDAVPASTRATIFGRVYNTPIMTAALSHLKVYQPQADQPMEEYARGAAMVGTMHWIGMTDSDELRRVMGCCANTVRIVKPYADRDKALAQLQEAQALGAPAVGMDMDHMFGADGRPDVVQGETMGVYTADDWRAMIGATNLPFIVKGVLSVRDAVRCQELGAAGIVVSHHNGRLPDAVPPLLVLPDIRRALGPDFTIFVDCGIASGLDAYKALALGANAVCVGTHLIPVVVQKGADGVRDRLQAMTDELRGLMAATGVKDLASFDSTVLHLRQF